MLGDLERSSQLPNLLEPYADRMIVNARGALHAGSVAYALARLAAGCEDNAAADQLYQHAAQRDQQAGAPAWVLRDLHHHGDFLHAIEHHERANALAQRAAALAGVITSAASRAE